VAAEAFSATEVDEPGAARPSMGRIRSIVRQEVTWSAMSKRTVKRKIRSKKKANHGKRPNCGRG